MKRTIVKRFATLIMIAAIALITLVFASADDADNYYMFNVYQAEFYLKDEVVIVKGAISPKGFTETIYIKTLNGKDFRSLDFDIWTAYCDIVFSEADNILEYYNDYFDESKTQEHRASELYSEITRETIISSLLSAMKNNDKISSYTAVISHEKDYNWVNTSTLSQGQSGLNIAQEDITVTFNGVNTPIIIDGNKFVANENSRFVFATLDGVFTFSGIPSNFSKLMISEGDRYSINGNIFTVIRPNLCAYRTAVGGLTGSRIQRDILLDNSLTNNVDFFKHTNCSVTINDNKNVCDTLHRNFSQVWLFDYSEITKDYTPVQSAQITNAKYLMYMNEEQQLKVKINPANANYSSITWVSLNPDIISIDQSGLVKAISPGTAKIHCIISGRGTISKFTIGATITVKDKPAIFYETIETVVGRTFKVPINIANNPGVSGITLALSYDPKIFNLIGVEYNNWEGIDNSTKNNNDGTLNMVFWKPDNYTENTTLAYLIFEVKDRGNLTNRINIDKITACNQELKPIEFEAITGIIDIFNNVISGDTNGDGKVTVADAVLLAQQLAGWNVKTARLTADCNGDGVVTIADAVLLAQRLAGWNVTLR